MGASRLRIGLPTQIALAATLTAGLLFTSSAHADVPALQINWSVNGGTIHNLTPSGTDFGNGSFGYLGSDLDFATGISLDFNLAGAPGGLGDIAQISGNIATENITNDTIDMWVQIILPVGFSAPFSELQGSASLGLTSDADGGILSSIPGTPVWQSLIDGNTVGNPASLFFDPFMLQNSGLGSSGASDNFGIPNAVLGPQLVSTIGIEINFSLTTLDQASITSVLRVVPGPSGLMLIACGAVFSRRRRRD